LLALAALLGGCDPAIEVDGTVRGLDDRPVAGAEVVVQCPEGAGRTPFTEPVFTSDAGTFHFPGALGCASARCTVAVRKPTGEHGAFAVGSHCRGRRLGCGQAWCSEVRVDARF
jgi:hypothetical protein